MKLLRLIRITPLLLLAALLGGPLSATAHAATTSGAEKGLLITPVQQFLSTNAGSALKSSFSVANLTDKPLDVTLSVKQFSVTNYVYNYKFEEPSNNWLYLSTASVTLQPNQTKEITYTFQVPAKAAPGGHYYTLLASANLSTEGLNSIIQAADLVYLTVNGKLNTVSHLESSSIKWLSFGKTIPFTLQPINTGNVYSYIYVSGELHGLFVRPPTTSGAHLLMPGKVREVKDSIPSPILPGIYMANYGYRTADSNWIVEQSHLVVYIPPWSIAFLLAALLIAGKFWPRKRRRNTDGSPDESGEIDESTE